MNFAWSYSRLKNYETCPRKHWEVDIKKAYREAKTPQLKWGDQVHDAFKKRFTTGLPLPDDMRAWEPMCAEIERTPGTTLVEQQLAIKRDFTPTAYFGNDVWFRTVIDVAKISLPVAAAIDWKTGEIKSDSVQLALSAQAVFSHYPDVMAVHTEFRWLKFGDVREPELYERSSMATLWRGLLPRVAAMEVSHIQQVYPPKPSGICVKHCPVRTCPFHGKGNRR